MNIIEANPPQWPDSVTWRVIFITFKNLQGLQGVLFEVKVSSSNIPVKSRETNMCPGHGGKMLKEVERLYNCAIITTVAGS